MRNALRLVEVQPGLLKATMNNGNFISFRTEPQSGFSPTIDLNFPSIFEGVKRIIKFAPL